MLERGRIQERLERGPGLTAAAGGTIELRLPEVAAADEREDVAAARIDRHERRLELRIVEPAQPVGDRPLGGILQVREEASCAPPSRADGRRRTRRGTAGAGTPSRSRRADRSAPGYGAMRMRVARAVALLRLGDEPLLAHARRARRGCARARRVGWSRATGRRARAPAPRSAHIRRGSAVFAGLAEQVPRHRFDAVDTGAQVDAIEVQLENLLLRELRRRSSARARLRGSCGRTTSCSTGRACVRAAASACCRLRRLPDARMSRHDGAAERNRIDARVMEEPVVLDRDERVLQVERDVGERHVLAAARPCGTTAGRRRQGTRCRRRRGAACGRPMPGAASTST